MLGNIILVLLFEGGDNSMPTLSLGIRKQRGDKEAEESQGWKHLLEVQSSAGFDDAITLQEITRGARNSQARWHLFLLPTLPLYLTLGVNTQILGSGMKLSHSYNKIYIPQKVNGLLC